MFDIRKCFEEMKQYTKSRIGSENAKADLEQEIIAEFERLNKSDKLLQVLSNRLTEVTESENKLSKELGLLNIELSSTKTLLASSEKALEDRDKTSIKISIKDDNVIGFIYYRLKNVHNENPNVDYMINLNELQQKIKRVIINQNQTP